MPPDFLESRQVLTMMSSAAVALGPPPTQVEARDFNADGINDLIELNSTVATVSVLLGASDGTYAPGINSSSVGYGRNMAINDFDHDGYFDVAINHGSMINIIHGHGDESFGLSDVHYVGAYANDIETGDFNEDGYDDIVTASFSYGGTTELYVNDKLGGFLPAKNISIGPTGAQVEVGDVDGDHHLDLVQSDGTGVVAVLKGSGIGTFSSSKWVKLTASAQDLEVEDFNNDGYADLTITDGNTVSVIAGSAAATLQQTGTYTAAGATRLVVGDLNGDGTKDILSNSAVAILGRGDGGFYAPTSYGGATGSDVSLGDLNGDGELDAVAIAAAPGAGVSYSLNGQNDRQLISTATELRVSAPNTVVAGTAFDVTISALDAEGNVVSDFLGTIGVGVAGGRMISYTFTAADAGVHTITGAATLFSAGTASFSVTTPFLPDAVTSVTVQATQAARFLVTAPTTTVAGQTGSATVAVQDAYGNAVSNYLGTVTVSSSDPKAPVAGTYTFTAEDAGQHAVDFVLKTAGSQTVTVTDSTSAAVSGRSGVVTVTAAEAASLTLSGGNVYAGSSNAIRVQAWDSFGNAATGYTGVVHLTVSDTTTTTSADAALVAGTGTFSVTPIHVGIQSLVATDVGDAGITGTSTINVTPGWGSRIVATPLTKATAGQTQSTNLTIYDSLGNVSTVFTGYVAVTSSDPRAGVSYHYFSAADRGIKTIPVTLYTAGVQAVTILDPYNAAMTTTQAGISIAPAAASYMSVPPLKSVVAGTAQSFTVALKDPYGNVATNYTGTIAFTSTDAKAARPAAYTFTATDAGSHTFSMTFKSSGSEGLTVVETTNAALVNTLTDVEVFAGKAVGYSIRVASNVTVGTPFTVIVSAVDAFGNVDVNYTGKIRFSGPSGCGNALPPDYQFSAADGGVHSFSVTLSSTGTQSIGIQDLADGKLKAQFSVKVVTGTTSGGGTSTGGGGGSGGGGGGKSKV